MGGLISGQMLAEGVPCSVLQGRIVQRTHKKFLALAGFNFSFLCEGHRVMVLLHPWYFFHLNHLVDNAVVYFL